MININKTIQTRAGVDVVNPIAVLNPIFSVGEAKVKIAYYVDTDALATKKSDVRLTGLPILLKTAITLEEFFGNIMVTLHDKVAEEIEKVTGEGTTTIDTSTQI